MSAPEDMATENGPREPKILRIDPNEPYARASIVITTPLSTEPILPTASSHSGYLALHCAPLESELLHQVTIFKSHLRSIKSGPEFWRSLAKGLSNLLGSQYTCISKRLDTIESHTGMPSLDEEGSCIQALAWYHNCSGSRTGVFEDVKYTGFCAPCGLMRHNTTCLVPSGLMETFPNNPNISSFIDAPDAYLGVPMFDATGINVGHIAVIWSKEGRERCPYSWTTMEFVLHVFVEMATQRFLENADSAFEKEDMLAEAAVKSNAPRGSHVPPTPATEIGSPRYVQSPKLIPSMFLPFPAAIAANISHEIRTPLQGIIGLLEILYAQVDLSGLHPSTTTPPPSSSHDGDSLPQNTLKALLEGIQENSNRLMDFADKLGEYYSIATDIPAFESSPAPSRKRKEHPQDTDEEIIWATGGAQRKFLKRRKLGVSTTDIEDSSSTDNRPLPSRSIPSTNIEYRQVSIRSTIRQIVKHILTRHEVAAIWGGKKLGLLTHDPETRMRSVLLGEGEESLLLEWNVADDVPRWLYCGKTGLQRTIEQLLVNAIKFTPTGRITLQVTKQPARYLSTTSNHEIVLFSIKDTGIGVEEQFQEYLAQPFFQVDPSMTRARDGSGLGLSLAHRWASKAGGALYLERSCTDVNNPHHGSEFSLRLPITDTLPLAHDHEADDSDDEWTDTSNTSQRSLDSTSPSRTRPKDLATASNAYDSHLASLYPFKIMVVEDNAILRRVMSQLLQKLGYKSSQMVLCNNGQEAVDYFRSRTPKEFDIDLILMDCWMPIMDGIDATRVILDMFPSDLKKFPGVKPDIVAITADNLPANLAKTEDSGMRGYMVKPIKLNDLQRVVEECAEGNWIMKKLAT